MKNIIINPLEVQWMTNSTVDPVGRVFKWEGNIYRAIRKPYSSFFQELLDKNILKNISQNAGLINTKKTSLTLDGFGLILQHDQITFPSYPFEWSSEMFRNAALLICDLSIALDRYNLELKDVHPYNVMFENYLPKFIDAGSIRRKEGKEWNLKKAFILNILYPLYSLAEGKNEQVRFLFRNELDGSLLTEKISCLIPLKYKILNRLLSAKKDNTVSAVKHYREKIEKIKLKSSQTEWSSYHKDDNYFLPFDKQKRWYDKQKNVYKLLAKLKPSTVLDLGSNIGWYAELAARSGAQVVATDIDEQSINLLYLRTKKTKLRILPLIVDFMKSTASNIAWPGASERLKCDVVLALALTHHLVFKNHLYFDTIAEELNKFSKKWLIVEFVPPDDKYIKNWIKEEHYWYSLDNFVTSLNKFFRRIEILDSAPFPRKLIFCQK